MVLCNILPTTYLGYVIHLRGWGVPIPDVYVYYVRGYVRNSHTFPVWISSPRFVIKHTKNENIQMHVCNMYDKT